MEEAKVVKESKKVKKMTREEEEVVETALAAAGAALLVSGTRKLLQCVLARQWPGFLVGPSPLLFFLLLQLIIGSIVFVSTHPPVNPVENGNNNNNNNKKANKYWNANKNKKAAESFTALPEKKNHHHHHVEHRELRVEERAENEFTAEELNARAEAFISAFRRQLKFDSISSTVHRRGTAASFRC